MIERARVAAIDLSKYAINDDLHVPHGMSYDTAMDALRKWRKLPKVYIGVEKTA